MAKKFFLLLFLSIFSFCLLARAQEEREPIVASGDRVEYFEEGRRVVATGNVVITYRGMKLTCERVVVHMDTREAEAEGDVRLYQEGSIFSGQRMRYNFDTKKGTIIEASAETPPWYGRGEEVRKVSDEEFRIRQGYITTCDLDEPHYRIQAKKIFIYLGDKVVARNVVFYVRKVPLFYLPYYSHPLDDPSMRVSIIPGQNKDWGWYLLTAWRYYFNRNSVGHIHLDYREIQKEAFGIDYNYRLRDFGEGELKTYYINEKEGIDGKAADERYRVSLKHRWQILEDTVGLLEFHKMSDREFIEDYFYREYEEDIQPDSFISITRTRPNYNLNLKCAKRVNRFYTEIERLPELELNVRRQRIRETNFYYKAEASFANLIAKTADTDQDREVFRFDTHNGLSYPTRLPGRFNWLVFTPHIEARHTLYSKDEKGDEDILREIYYGGFDMTTQFYKIYDVVRSFLNIEINRLRHLITPRINYNYIHKPTVPPSELMSFDDIDSIEATKIYTFSLENKLQTRWRSQEEAEMEKVDLVDLLIKVDFLPHSEEESFSDITAELELRPYRWLAIESDAVYDPYAGYFETVNTDLIASGGDKWRFGFGSRYQKDVSHQVTAEASYRIDPKWKVRTYGRYEFETDTLKEQEYTIYRDLHCWLAELSYNEKEDDRTIWLVLRIKAFPHIPFAFKTSYPGPR